MYYNEWNAWASNCNAINHWMTMAYVDYDDGTDNSLSQLSEDVTNFLVWSAEPELELRKNLGIKVILFFIIFRIVYLYC